MIQRRRQQGFTIIELMIATVVSSLVLLLCLAGIMQISKMYYRGITTARTQEAARSILDDIAESIRLSNEAIVFPMIDADNDGAIDDAGVQTTVLGPEQALPGNLADDKEYFFCIGSKRYSYAIDRQVKQNPDTGRWPRHNRHGLWVDSLNGGACTAPADLDDGSLANGTELLGENMRLTRLAIEEFSGGMFTIHIGVAYGEDDLLQPYPVGVDSSAQYTQTCEGVKIGMEFCAVSNLSVTVKKRL